jgi:hypothetical protein
MQHQDLSQPHAGNISCQYRLESGDPADCKYPVSKLRYIAQVMFMLTPEV